MAKKPKAKDVEATIDELVTFYSKAELKKMGGRESLRKAAAQLVTIRAQYTDVEIPVGRAPEPEPKPEPPFTEGYTDDHRLNILAEVKSTAQKKASDLTQRYTILLETNNPNLLDLGKLPYDVILEVTFNLSDQKLKS